MFPSWLSLLPSANNLASKAVPPEAISLDGVTDYLSRSSDFIGNTDGKTFTFSCNVYHPAPTATTYLYSSGDNGINDNSVNVNISGSSFLSVNIRVSATNAVAFISDKPLPVDTFLNIEISLDTASASNRHVYINDKELSVTWTAYTLDTLIPFARNTHGIGNFAHLSLQGDKARLSNLFLDYTYRDLSIEANRRLFITADGKPADWATLVALNPILALQMKDKATAHINDAGTGNMVQNGLIETADVGPNQNGTVMCTIDGGNFLTHANETGATLSYWAVNSGIMTHHYSTGSVNIGDITSALGDAVGEVYLTTATIAESEFITDDGKGIPVREVISNTGDNPKIALPCSADNPTVNYGSAGDYGETGSVAGFRGSFEEWSRGAVVDGANYLTGSIFCQSLVKWKSLDGGATWSVTYANAVTVTNIGNGTDNGVVAYYLGLSDNINWALEANKNLVTNQLGWARTMATVIIESGWTPVLGLDFKNTANFGLNLYGADYAETGTIVSGADVTV